VQDPVQQGYTPVHAPQTSLARPLSGGEQRYTPDPAVPAGAVQSFDRPVKKGATESQTPQPVGRAPTRALFTGTGAGSAVFRHGPKRKAPAATEASGPAAAGLTHQARKESVRTGGAKGLVSLLSDADVTSRMGAGGTALSAVPLDTMREQLTQHLSVYSGGPANAALSLKRWREFEGLNDSPGWGDIRCPSRILQFLQSEAEATGAFSDGAIRSRFNGLKFAALHLKMAFAVDDEVVTRAIPPSGIVLRPAPSAEAGDSFRQATFSVAMQCQAEFLASNSDSPYVREWAQGLSLCVAASKRIDDFMCSDAVEYRNGTIIFEMHDDRTDRSRVSAAAGSGLNNNQPWTVLRWSIKTSGMLGEWEWAPSGSPLANSARDLSGKLHSPTGKGQLDYSTHWAG
jgi:hypothetical protein